MKHSLEMVLLLVLLSSLSNKTILHNEKTFQNNWFCYSYPYYSGSSFLYFVSTPLPKDNKEKSRSTYNSSSQSDSLGFYRRRFSFRGNHHYLWDKNAT
jgi:hypothetical protein